MLKTVSNQGETTFTFFLRISWFRKLTFPFSMIHLSPLDANPRFAQLVVVAVSKFRFHHASAPQKPVCKHFIAFFQP